MDYITNIMTEEEHQKKIHDACFREWASYVFDDRKEEDGTLRWQAENALYEASLYFRNGVHLTFELVNNHIAVRDGFFNDIIYVSGYKV